MATEPMTCGCGASVYTSAHWNHNGYHIGHAGYCPEEVCGDKLLPGGGVESRAEVQRKADALDRLEADRFDLWISPSYATDDDGKDASRLGVHFLAGQEFRTLTELAESLPAPEKEE